MNNVIICKACGAIERNQLDHDIKGFCWSCWYKFLDRCREQQQRLLKKGIEKKTNPELINIAETLVGSDDIGLSDDYARMAFYELKRRIMKAEVRVKAVDILDGHCQHGVPWKEICEKCDEMLTNNNGGVR